MTTQNKVLNLDPNKGLLFPTATGVTGGIKVEEVYYEVSNSSITDENGIKTLNASLKKLGGRKAFDIHLTRSKFIGDKAPAFVSNNIMVESVEYQLVGWVAVSKTTGKSFYSIAVNEVKQFDMI